MNRAFLLSILLLTSCSRVLGPPQEVSVKGDFSKAAEPFEVSTDLLKGKSIRDFITIVFKAGYTPEQWKAIFDKTKNLTTFRNQIIELDDRLAEISTERGFEKDSKDCIEYGKSSPTHFETKEELVSCIGDLKFGIYADLALIVEDIRQENAAYILVMDESKGCQFTQSDDVSHFCTVDADTFPEVIAPWKREIPKLTDIWVYPALSSLVRGSQAANTSFEFKFRLRAEQAFQHTLKFVGDVEVKAGSQFFLNGQPVNHDPFGYAELTLSR